mmetsp:Transcript_21875/g.54091  ORF Transcript_21875/g.54091 Transcript_21875/m.54091 type:complete len:232 (+) Transcript_21875:1275-1970(+)
MQGGGRRGVIPSSVCTYIRTRYSSDLLYLCFYTTVLIQMLKLSLENTLQNSGNITCNNTTRAENSSLSSVWCVSGDVTGRPEDSGGGNHHVAVAVLATAAAAATVVIAAAASFPPLFTTAIMRQMGQRLRPVSHLSMHPAWKRCEHAGKHLTTSPLQYSSRQMQQRHSCVSSLAAASTSSPESFCRGMVEMREAGAAAGPSTPGPKRSRSSSYDMLSTFACTSKRSRSWCS